MTDRATKNIGIVIYLVSAICWLVVICLCAAMIASMSGCTLHVPVDKRVTVINFIHAQSAVGSVTVTIPTTTTNTSDTQADAQQAIDGALTIPLLP